MKLRDAIGEDVYLIGQDQYTDTGLQNLPTEKLERLKMRISLKASSLATAIKAKWIDHANGGEGATNEWYVSHSYALTINQRMLPYINSLIKQRRRSGRSMGDHFMDQARLILPRNDFETILEKAQMEKEGSDGKTRGL